MNVFFWGNYAIMDPMKTKVEIIYKPDLSTSGNQRIFSAKVSAGFPSPAGDYEESRLDLNRYLEGTRTLNLRIDSVKQAFVTT